MTTMHSQPAHDQAVTPTNSVSHPAPAGTDLLLEQLDKERERFRGDVREAILKQHRAGNWCLPGSNDVLEDLGLPPIAHTYTGTVTVTVQVAVSGAADVHEAANFLNHHLTAVSGDTSAVDVQDFTVEHYAADRLNQSTPH
jgi:hypothetical protein